MMLGLFPLNQKATVIKSAVDEWGIASDTPTETEYDVRVDYSSAVEMLTSDGKEVKTTAKLYFKGIPDIDYTDDIRFDRYERKPIRIQPLRDLSGEIFYTRVFV
ncbi:hypothetical protein FT641_27200 [Bacillus paranthracis]|uniref:hypothetical protein n=2 Tax=Bacillus paranthracis TaxID=2026186 RepID=UPI000BFBD835|nr:hypothetical protein [Bacillus paranthracis]MBE7117262.1 hypothetical protein [Bacillus paranthracis]MBE7134876.1 hypothetical protein [Bacillus paranthracis]MBE7156364.1 hypothetical protein [Bacillus paranthracis]PGZ29496.1 hypothetical protein COE50_22035 [Bacillus anthracis]